MKILILISDYLPDHNPNVFRWSHIAEHWVKQGHAVHILTPKRHDAADKAEISGVRVWRAGQGTLLDWLSNIFRFSKKRGRHYTGKGLVKKPKISRTRLALETVVRLTWRKVYWPDNNCIWKKRAIEKASDIIASEGIEAVITLCYPFTAVLVGEKLKQDYPEVRWLIDVEDPFSIDSLSAMNNFNFYKRKNRVAEQRCFKAADAIVFTNENVVQEYETHLQISSGKTAVIPPLWVKPSASKRDYNLDPDELHCAYIGAFYKHVRQPEPLLEVLQRVIREGGSAGQRLKFHFFGSIPPVLKRSFDRYPEVGRHMYFHGFRPRGEVFAAMQAMDFLINVGNATSYQLPSKVVDYYASGRPVVNICQIRNDSFARFFNDHPACLNVLPDADSDDQKHFDSLIAFIERSRQVRIDQDLIDQKLKGHHVDQVAKAYLDLIKPGTEI